MVVKLPGSDAYVCHFVAINYKLDLPVPVIKIYNECIQVFVVNLQP